MRLNFKVVSGRSGSITVGGQTLVSEMARILALELGLSSVQLTLLAGGVKLDSTRTVSHYRIPNDGTVTVLVKKLSPFELKLSEVLAREGEDADACLGKFFGEYERWLGGLNLDQVERIARNLQK